MRIVNIVDGALRALVTLCLIGLTVLVLFQVVSRYVFGSVPLFAEETARFAMIWMAMMAAALGVRDAANIRIDLVPAAIGRLSPRVLRLLEALLESVSLTVFLVLAWYGLDAMLFAHGQTSPGMGIPLSYPYAVMPIAFVCAAVFSALRIVYGPAEHSPESQVGGAE
nr:TRAP transporter small permease [Pseudooceanicola sp. HF7]